MQYFTHNGRYLTLLGTPDVLLPPLRAVKKKQEKTFFCL
jgi:hypothetical protein